MQILVLFFCMCALSGVGEFSFNQIVNAVDNIFDLVQKTYENYDCKFTCPFGFKKYPRKNYNLVSNGCGSLGVEVDFSYFPALVLCCDDHDICYQTCGYERDFCDNSFLMCLSNACDKAKKKKLNSGALLSINSCKMIVDVIYQAVITLGCKSYIDSQKEACVCKKVPTSTDL